MGETWAENECAEFEEVCRTMVPFSAQLRHLVDDLASSGQQITKSQALKIIAGEKGMSSAELLRKAPWLPNVWARVNKTNQVMRKLTE